MYHDSSTTLYERYVEPVKKGKIEGLRNLKPLKRLRQFGVGDYVGDIIRHAIIQNDRPSEVSRQVGEMLLSRNFLVFSGNTYVQEDPRVHTH